MKLHVGTSGYSYKEWKGAFYPEGLSERKFLHYYGEHFRAVEINNTFYRMPEASVLEGWRDEVPADFSFALKAPQRITHLLRLHDAAEAVSHLLSVVQVLGERLGPLLFQLPPAMKKDVPRLQDFLALFPPQQRLAFEFRHQSWFDDEVISLLRRHGAALCIADAETELKVPFVATASWGYLRLRRQAYDDDELRDWGQRVQRQRWHDAFVFFKHEDLARGPRFALRFLELAAE